MDDEGPERKSFRDRLRDITPDFLSGGGASFFEQERAREDSGKSEFQKEREREEKLNQKKAREGAAGKLSAAEAGATGASGGAGFGKGLSGAAARENGGLFTGSGRPAGKGLGGAGAKGNARGANFRGRMKKAAPITAILALIVGFGGLLFSASSMMPVAIEELIIEKFNSIGVSSTTASDSWLDLQLNQGQGDAKSDNLNEKYGFSSEQINSFRSQGMKVVTTSGGVMAILFQDTNGGWIPVVGSAHINDAGLSSEIAAAAGFAVGTPISAKTALATKEFKVPYTTASKSWRGGSSGWFDQIMSNITETKLAINRNRWSGYASRSLGKMTAEFKKTASSVAKTKTEDYSGSVHKFVEPEDYDGSIKTGDSFVPCSDPDSCGYWGTDMKNAGQEMEATVTPKYDSEGKLIGYDIDGSNKDSVVNGVADVNDLNGKLTQKALRAADVARTARTAAAAIDTTCGIIEGLMSIYAVVSAYQNLQFLNLVSGFLESVDKVKAGDDKNSPIDEYSTNLVTAASTVDGADGTASVKEGKKTAMESQGMAWLFSNSAINSNDTSVRNVNFESIMSNLSVLTSNISLTAHAYETCGYARVVSGVANLVSTAIMFIPVVGGAVKVSQVAFDIAKGAVIGGVIQLFFMAVMPMIAQKVFNSIVKDAATEWFGEDLGNAMVSGASKYLGGNGVSGGQGPGSREKVIAYLGEQQAVIADEAEYQRAIRDPLDVTSKYTFLGSIAYALMPMAYSSGGVMTAIKNVSTVTTSSLVALTPAASAVDVNNAITSTGDCPLLESVGIMGDAFCNSYTVTDVATVRSSPVAVETAVQTQLDSKGRKNFNDDGSVNPKSDLAKYIAYCGQRTSQYGVKDAGTAERLDNEAESEKGWFAKIISMLPIIGDTQTILESVKAADTLQWVTGEACVVSDDNKYWNGTVADNDNHTTRSYHLQDYQRYAENERLLENMNSGYKSPVTAYLEQYYEENPVDTSLEGTLARFSGMTVEQVDTALALLEYYEFVAEYEPAERYAFGEPVYVETDGIFFESDSEFAYILYIVPEVPEYFDVRNRVFVV